MDYRALQAEILADQDCAPYINDGSDPSRKASAPADDASIAAIRSGKRQSLATQIFTERTIREKLSVKAAYLILKTLRDLAAETTIPAWLTNTLAAGNIPADDHIAYFDTLQCGWAWLQGDGINIGSPRTLQALGIIAAGLPDVANAANELAQFGYTSNPVSAADVSRAMRGPWG